MPRRVLLLAGALIATAVVATPPAGAVTPPANRCVAVKVDGRYLALAGNRYRANAASPAHAARFYVKPTGLGTYMLYDDGAKLLSAGGGGRFARSGVAGPRSEWTAGRSPFTFVPASQCAVRHR